MRLYVKHEKDTILFSKSVQIMDLMIWMSLTCSIVD